MTDNGGGEPPAEVEQGLSRLGLVHERVLPYSPYKDAKRESLLGSTSTLDSCRFLEGVTELTLEQLNRAPSVFVELEYNRRFYSELRCAPVERFLKDKNVLRSSPTIDELRCSFRMKASRKQRRSDGTLTVEGVRFELPSRSRHLDKVVRALCPMGPELYRARR